MFELPPDTPPVLPPMLVAAAPDTKAITRTDPKTANRTIGICHLANNPDNRVFTAENVIDPVASVWQYLERIEKQKVAESAYMKGKATLLQGPSHGSVKDEGNNYYTYMPVPGYFEADSATFQILIGGWQVKAHYYFRILKNGPGGTEGYDPYMDKELCPNGRYWKISLNYTTVVATSNKQVRHNKPLEPTR